MQRMYNKMSEPTCILPTFGKKKVFLREKSHISA